MKHNIMRGICRCPLKTPCRVYKLDLNFVPIYEGDPADKTQKKIGEKERTRSSSSAGGEYRDRDTQSVSFQGN